MIRFRYEGPDQRGFSFCNATIKSRKQFAARNSHKGDGRGPSEQFYLTTELSNVVGISFIFVTSFGRYPCRRWKCNFVSNFSVHRFRSSFSSVPKFPLGTEVTAALEHRLSVDSQITVICYGSVNRPLFRSQQPGALLYIARSPTFSVSCTNCVTVTSSFRSHCFAFPISHSSSFEFLLRKYKHIF